MMAASGPRRVVWDLSGLPPGPPRLLSRVAIHPMNRQVEVMPTILSSECIMDREPIHRSVSEVAFDATQLETGASEERIQAGSDVSAGSVAAVSVVSNGSVAPMTVTSTTSGSKKLPEHNHDCVANPCFVATPAAAFFRQLRPNTERLDIIHTRPLRQRIYRIDFDIFEFCLLSELFIALAFLVFSMFLLAIGKSIANIMIISISFAFIAVPSMWIYSRLRPEAALVVFSFLTVIMIVSESGIIFYIWTFIKNTDSRAETLTVQSFLLGFLLALQTIAGLASNWRPFKPIKKIQGAVYIKQLAYRSFEKVKKTPPYEPSITSGPSQFEFTEMTHTGSEIKQAEPELIPYIPPVPNVTAPAKPLPTSKPVNKPFSPAKPSQLKNVPSIVAKTNVLPVKTETVKVPSNDPLTRARLIPMEPSTENSEQKSEKDENKCIKILRKPVMTHTKIPQEPPRTPITPVETNLKMSYSPILPHRSGSDSRNVSVEMPSPPHGFPPGTPLIPHVNTVLNSQTVNPILNSASKNEKEKEPMSDQDKPFPTPSFSEPNKNLKLK